MNITILKDTNKKNYCYKCGKLKYTIKSYNRDKGRVWVCQNCLDEMYSEFKEEFKV